MRMYKTEPDPSWTEQDEFEQEEWQEGQEDDYPHVDDGQEDDSQ